MKSLFIFIFFIVNLSTFAIDTLKVSSKEISPGENVFIEFLPAEIYDSLIIYYYISDGETTSKVYHSFMYRKNANFEFNLKTEKNTSAIFLHIRDKNHQVIYNNNDFIKVKYLESNNFLADCQIAKYFSKPYCFETKNESNPQLAIELFEKAFLNKPELEKYYIIPFINSLLEINPINKERIQYTLKKYYESENSEILWLIYNTLRRLDLNSDSDFFYQKIKGNFPCDYYISNHSFTETVSNFVNSKDFKERVLVKDNYLTSIGEKFHCYGNQFNLRWLYGELFSDYLKSGLIIKWFDETNKLDPKIKLLTYSLTLSKISNFNPQELQYGKKIGKLMDNLKEDFLLRERNWNEPLTLSDFEVLHNRKKQLAGGFISLASIYENLNELDSAFIFYDYAIRELSQFEYEDLNQKYLNFIKKIKIGNFKDIELEISKFQKKDPILSSYEKHYYKGEHIKINKNIKLIDSEFYNLNIFKSNGDLFELADSKIYVLNFWASWCITCLAKFPTIDFLMKKYKDNKNVEIILVNTLDNKTDEKIFEIINKQGFNFNTTFDRNNELKELYQINSLPYLMIIDKNKHIRYKELGFKPDDTISNIVSILEKLLKIE